MTKGLKLKNLSTNFAEVTGWPLKYASVGKNLTEASKMQQWSERNLAFKDRAVPHEFSEFTKGESKY